MISIDLSKQQVLDATPKAIQQIIFTANLDRAGNISARIGTRLYFIPEEAKKKGFWVSTRNCKSFVNENIITMFNFYRYKK